LQSVYKVLKRVFPEGTTVARLGGDEFGIVVRLGNGIDPMILSQKAVDACSQSFEILGQSVEIGASIGMLVSTATPAGDGMEQMRCADLALFAAKRSGRGVVRQYDAEMDKSTRFRQLIEAGLREAIVRNELSLVYQPIVERQSLTVIGFEALLRWQSPKHGEISPGVFIPIAEESGLIHEIGDWVITQALEDCKFWPNQYVSINFSAKQFKSELLATQLAARAKEIGVPFSRIQVEITETAIFDNVDRAAETIRNLQEMGFRVALDDFGTGYSSLLSVKNFKLDCIKIDKSFVDELGEASDSMAIIQSLTYMARSLGLNIVAEGVETDMQCQSLRVAGCSHLQGYLFGKPVAIDHSFSQDDGTQRPAQQEVALKSASVRR
jgi:predicted signal transduction protein with EAL and GGDEF domain